MVELPPIRGLIFANSQNKDVCLLHFYLMTSQQVIRHKRHFAKHRKSVSSFFDIKDNKKI